METLPAVITPGDVLAQIDKAEALATRMCGTTFVPVAFKDKPMELLAAILTGAEMGLPPMSAMNKFHNIKGKSAPSAEAQRAVVLSKGHEIWIEEASDVKVTMGGRRRGSKQTSFVTWTVDKAKNAGLFNTNPTWKKYPQDMLIARASAALCRTVFADCLSGVSYTVEELQDGLDADFADDVAATSDRPADAPKPPRETSKRKAPAKAKAETRASKPAPPPPPPVADPLAEVDELDAIADGTADLDDEIVEAEIVEDDDGSGALPPDRALARRAGELDINDHDRHGLYRAVSGSATGTGKELTTEQVQAVFDLFDRWDVVELVEDPVGEWTVVVEGAETFFGVDETAALGREDVDQPALPSGEEGWRAYLKEYGRRIGETVRFAADAASDLGVSPVPRSLGELADSTDEVQHRAATFVRTGE